jgi:hypothetical protein
MQGIRSIFQQEGLSSQQILDIIYKCFQHRVLKKSCQILLRRSRLTEELNSGGTIFEKQSHEEHGENLTSDIKFEKIDNSKIFLLLNDTSPFTAPFFQ